MQARVFQTKPLRSRSCPFRPSAFSNSKKPSVSSRFSGLMTLEKSKSDRSSDLEEEKNPPGFFEDIDLFPEMPDLFVFRKNKIRKSTKRELRI
jgi:hypothetical protein